MKSLFSSQTLKFLLETLGVCIGGLFVVFASFSVAIGPETTLRSFFRGLTNLGEVKGLVAPPASRSSVDVSEIASNGDDGYRNLDLTNYQVKTLNITIRTEAALAVPTTGLAAHPNFLYHEVTHPGVDIWSEVDGSGIGGTSKGYTVFAACGGTVIRVFQPNEEIEIDCDVISEDYRDSLPSLDIKVLYSHMGDGVSKEQYHNLKIGQKVEKGELVGYQGNISSFVPENRVTHLHFGVYDMKTLKPLDPSPYIGFSSISLGQKFEALK